MKVTVCILLIGNVFLAYAQTILPGPPTALPDYIGAPAKAHPLPNSGVPQNPLLAPNPFNSVHEDTWNSDVVDIPGPLGRNPVVFSSTLEAARTNTASEIYECLSITFDSHGRLVAGCAGLDEASVVLIDPASLAVLSSYQLPAAAGDSGFGPNMLSASYNYLDKRDRFAISIAGNKIITLAEGGSPLNPVLELDRTYDVSMYVPADKRISGLMLDWQGRMWFYLSGSLETPTSPPIAGAICVLNPAVYPAVSAVGCHTFNQDEQIRNGHAITREATYVVSSKRMYRIEAGLDDQPYVVWSAPYDNLGIIKPGQYNAGSGTSPTILGNGKYVAIADNADPMKVVVYRTDKQRDLNDQIVCQVKVFEDQAGGALDNSLLGLGLSLIAENNYGYVFDGTPPETVTESLAGFDRVDIAPNGKSCRKVWQNREVASTTSGKISTRTGLVYTYARKCDGLFDANRMCLGEWVYYWTAMDFDTGQTVWQKQAGTGYKNFDSIWPGMAVGPNSTLYVGLFGGLAAVRDGN